MTGTVWVKRHDVSNEICRTCQQPFIYVRTGNKPRIRCDVCRRSRRLAQIRMHCTEYRRAEKIRLGLS